VTTSLDSETDVDSLEPLNTDGEDGLVDLVSEHSTVVMDMGGDMKDRIAGRDRQDGRCVDEEEDEG
jgi:hypothetical protein